MLKIAVLTATRAEYGLLSPVIKQLNKDDEMDVKVVVTGAHLSPEFGLTYKEIEADGIAIHKKIDCLLASDTPAAISKTMGLAMIGFAEYFEEYRPDALLVLGDRYETLAVCCAAMNARIPIIHLYGGETTEGAVDEAIRHAITKMSYLHLTSTEEYRKRVIQLGEAPERVFCVGAIGVENALHTELLSKEALAEELGFSLQRPYAVVTFHPVTLEENTAEEQAQQLLKAMDACDDMDYIVTKANADANGRIINHMMEQYASEHSNVHVYTSLGMKKYLSAVKYAEFVMGNSSSGLIEVPSFHIPTINIGNRQKGRTQSASVLNCEAEVSAIKEAITKARDVDFRQSLLGMENPYGDGETVGKIVECIRSAFIEKEVVLQKVFYDLMG